MPRRRLSFTDCAPWPSHEFSWDMHLECEWWVVHARVEFITLFRLVYSIVWFHFYGPRILS